MLFRSETASGWIPAIIHPVIVGISDRPKSCTPRPDYSELSCETPGALQCLVMGSVIGPMGRHKLRDMPCKMSDPALFRDYQGSAIPLCCRLDTSGVQEEFTLLTPCRTTLVDTNTLMNSSV